jgi:hypothetical protein
LSPDALGPGYHVHCQNTIESYTDFVRFVLLPSDVSYCSHTHETIRTDAQGLGPGSRADRVQGWGSIGQGQLNV